MIEIPDVYTSYWSNRELADLDVVIVSISRGDKKGVRCDAKLWVLAPSRETFDSADDWPKFISMYRSGLDQLGADHIVGELRRISGEHGDKPLVLLCHERAVTDCHRGLLADWYEQHTGNPVPELQAGDLPTRPDAPQRRLFQ